MSHVRRVNSIFLTQRTTAHSCVGITVGLESIYSDASVVGMTIPRAHVDVSVQAGRQGLHEVVDVLKKQGRT